MGDVEEILLGIVIGRGGDDDEVGVAVCCAAVERGRQVQRDGVAGRILAREVTLYVFVLDGTLAAVEELNLFRDDIHGHHMVALRKERGDTEADITCSCYCDIHIINAFLSQQIYAYPTKKPRMAHPETGNEKSPAKLRGLLVLP